MKFASAGILIDETKRILLIKRVYTKNNYPNYWALPGGGMEQGETRKETCIREVKEEVGLNFIPEKLFITDIVKNEDNLNVFRYIGKYNGTIQLQESECDGYGWFTYNEAKKLLINDRIDKTIEKLRKEEYIL